MTSECCIDVLAGLPINRSMDLLLRLNMLFIESPIGSSSNTSPRLRKIHINVLIGVLSIAMVQVTN